jgi:hypothetical protein
MQWLTFARATTLVRHQLTAKSSTIALSQALARESELAIQRNQMEQLQQQNQVSNLIHIITVTTCTLRQHLNYNITQCMLYSDATVSQASVLQFHFHNVNRTVSWRTG